MTLVVGALFAIALTAVMKVRSPGLNAAMTAYTNVGSPIGLPIVALLAIITLAVERQSRTPVILIAGVIAYLIMHHQRSKKARASTIAAG